MKVKIIFVTLEQRRHETSVALNLMRNVLMKVLNADEIRVGEVCVEKPFLFSAVCPGPFLSFFFEKCLWCECLILITASCE